MAINETISKGNKYRRLKDAANKVWQRISFWTAASDVEFENGNTLQSTLGTVTGITDSLTSNSSTVAASAAAVYSLNSKITSFSGSLSNLYNAFVAKGVTPSAKTLDACVAAVNTLQTTAYAAGRSSVSYGSASITLERGGSATWTCPQTGRYVVFGGGGTDSDANIELKMTVTASHNGSTLSLLSASAWAHGSMSAWTSLNKGDVITFSMQPEHTATWAGNFVVAYAY